MRNESPMLKLKEIIGYLPYGLRVVIIFNSEVREVIRWENDNLLKISAKSFPFSDIYKMDELKPLLLPIEEKFTPSGKFKRKSISNEILTEISLALGYKSGNPNQAWKYLTGNIASWAKDHSKAMEIIHREMIDIDNLIGQGKADDLSKYE